MNWAWEQPLPPVPKLVLMALADNADDHGYCWPKMKTIAAKCSTSERTVQRTIKTLLAAGLLNEYSHENRQAFASAAAIPPHAKPTGFRIVRR